MPIGARDLRKGSPSKAETLFNGSDRADGHGWKTAKQMKEKKEHGTILIDTSMLEC